ncbi:ArdC family protein [Phenylobacterium montanum]|uniref:DUF1738 domain-containing protein n=1 Tax=Phenylobacterium montanum TaxID=2823693 RepID=A0A975G2C4_9CAUL|nr:zincin-like metallopeptidase domain-containing protein [Caulobacter sp. S6]QUD89840.1 DUF1738 domain-containing protein [Caulobacter sp. S6]
MSASNRCDVYARVTQEIITAIETGDCQYRMPWHHDGAATTRPVNLVSGRAYRGINVVSLWAAAEANGFASGVWATFQQWRSKDCSIRRGEKASLAVLWKEVSRDDDEPSDDADQVGSRRRMFAKAFHLFNADQVEGYEPPEPPAILPESERLAGAEAFIKALGISTTFGAGSAYYHLVQDEVFLPNFSAFRDAHGFYATWLHECAHATGAKHRLDRDFTGKWSKDALAMEEMTAELAASFLLADLGIACHPREDHAAYVASWLKVLKDDPKAIFTAASKAQAAADWMHQRQPPS